MEFVSVILMLCAVALVAAAIRQADEGRRRKWKQLKKLR